MSSPTNTPGKLIRRARIAKGLTQQQLVDNLNDLLPAHEFIERSMISRWEIDQHYPRESRRAALEKILGIKLTAPPPKLVSTANYIKYQEQIQEHIIEGLHGCNELWLTSANSKSGVWRGMSELSSYFETLKRDDKCLVKELFYIQTNDDVKELKALVEKNYPSYRLSARIAPGQPLPILYIPQKKFGVILSGFGDDVRNVGLEMTGSIASFAEHTFRYRWVYSVVIVDSYGKVAKDKIRHFDSVLKNLGGSTDKIIHLR